jgi:hypothetical protein
MQFRHPESYRMVESYKILWDPASDIWTWVYVTQNRLNGSRVALDETKRRTKDMMSFNEQIEKTI